MSTHIPEIFADFSADGEFHSCEPIEQGHIHATFRVETHGPQGRKRYVLQRINSHVFHDARALMQNITLVTDHVRRKLVERGTQDVDRRVLRVVLSTAQQPFFRSASGEFWRLYDFVGGAHTVTDCPRLNAIYEVAFGFGEFLALLADFPPSQLTETIPNFHHGPLRYQSFQAAVGQDCCGRAAGVRDEIAFIVAHQSLLTEPQGLIDDERLPLRVTHNDTKSNNVMLDNITGKAVCVIDLDTVMPGLALYDLGDLVRTTVTGTAEDERDLGKVQVQMPRFERALRGFVAGTQGLLGPQEALSLLLGPPYMALIMAVRFLTDYLQGDTYYRIQYASHNLQRCRAQLALVRSWHASREKIAERADAILIG
jgi:hypothetical protein